MKKCKRYPVPRAYFVSTVRDRQSGQLIMGLPQIEDHLDHVFAPLVGTIPYARRCQLRAELRDRLMALAAEYVAAGRTPEQAVRRAIEGVDSVVPPATNSRVDGWRSRTLFGDQNVPIPSARGSFYTALIVFGVASVVLFMAVGSQNGLDGWSVAALPIVAGAIVGLRSVARPVLGTFYAMLALIPASLVLSVLLGSYYAPIIGMTQTLCWLPLGCLGAWFAARMRPRIVASLTRHSGQTVPLP